MGGFVVHDGKEYLGTLTFEPEKPKSRCIGNSNFDIHNSRGQAIAMAIARKREATLSFHHEPGNKVFLHSITKLNGNDLTVLDSIYFSLA
jgi:hypothetical protein